VAICCSSGGVGESRNAGARGKIRDAGSIAGTDRTREPAGETTEWRQPTIAVSSWFDKLTYDGATRVEDFENEARHVIACAVLEHSAAALAHNGPSVNRETRTGISQHRRQHNMSMLERKMHEIFRRLRLGRRFQPFSRLRIEPRRYATGRPE
jgi:hypothetical protein